MSHLLQELLVVGARAPGRKLERELSVGIKHSGQAT
jgi:hypothetical protein